MTQYDLFAGRPPSQRHSETSIAAAVAIKPKVGSLHARVLTYLRDCGPATDEEMQTGIPMGANTQRPRRRELEMGGLIADSGKRRANSSGKMAVVWRIA